MFFLLFFAVFNQNATVQDALELSEKFVKNQDFDSALKQLKEVESLIDEQIPVPVKRLVWYRLGYLYRYDQNHAEAKRLLSRAFNLEHQDPEDFEVRLRSGTLLISLHVNNQEWSDSNQVWKQVFELCDSNVPATSTGLNILILGGKLAIEQGDLGRAFDLLKQGHKLFLDHSDRLKDQRTLVVQELLRLADMFKGKKNFEPAQGIYEALFKDEERQKPLNLERVLALCFLVADASFRDGHTLQSHHYYEKALNLAKQQPGHEVAQGKALYGIAEVYSAWNNHKEAAPIYQESLEILRTHLPADDPELQLLEQAIHDKSSEKGGGSK